ncbi:hypothetical protein M3Y98_00605600 [Aphelenchoides besseyi]|nr:hypothetical protein M3Y98_00605600 [Aphelenchoides besseyi]KAI6208235.1 hypothetical protein M3Y96_00093700 [Aphelenchoides besseyi]
MSRSAARPGSSGTQKRKLKQDQRFSVERNSEQLTIAALISDVETLLKKFQETSSVSFFEFAQIFINLEFPTIFLGRYSMAELVEFSELILSYSSSFMFSGTETIEPPPSFIAGDVVVETQKLTITRKVRPLKERVFGVYLTYCLFFTQPQNHAANVKLSVKQMGELRRFCKEELLRDQCNEALFCISRLLNVHAFMVIPFEKEFNPLLARRFNVADLTIDNAELTEPSSEMSFLNSVEKDYTLMQIDLMHKRYVDEKNRIKLPDGLELVDESLLTSISSIVSRTERELRSVLK